MKPGSTIPIKFLNFILVGKSVVARQTFSQAVVAHSVAYIPIRSSTTFTYNYALNYYTLPAPIPTMGQAPTSSLITAITVPWLQHHVSLVSAAHIDRAPSAAYF
jgi:hypothetical protein